VGWQDTHIYRVFTIFKRMSSWGVMAFLVFQWAMPMRMPIISNGEFKYTTEGYRFSWTMMLHSKADFIQPGMFFGDLRPLCGNAPFPNPDKRPWSNPQAFPYTQMIGQRGHAALVMYPRQYPRIATTLRTTIQDMCPGMIGIYPSVHSSVNEGPFTRLLDPQANLTDIFDLMQDRPWPVKLWQSFIDKPPEGLEYMMRETGSLVAQGLVPKIAKPGWHSFVDRSVCLMVDPIRFFSAAVTIKVLRAPGAIVVKYCKTGDPNLDDDCVHKRLKKGKKTRFPESRSMFITIQAGPGDFCSDERGRGTMCGKGAKTPLADPVCRRAVEDIAFEVRVDNAERFKSLQ